MFEYQVYTARYPSSTIIERGERRQKIGRLEKRTELSGSINTKLKELGEGWKVASISVAYARDDLVFTVLFEKYREEEPIITRDKL
jgi:hypothetical protein